MKRFFSFQIIFVILLLAASVCAKDVWLEINTPNFQIVGNPEEKELREAAKKLEHFHESLQKSFSKIQLKTPFPGKVIIFDGDSKYRNSNQSLIEGEGANYLIITLDKNSPDNFADALHNYVNFLINNNLGQSKIPAWLNHGLAEYFINRSNTNNLLAAQQNNLSSLQILLETDYFTLQSQNEERKSLFSAQSLAFLSFLLNGKSENSLEKIEKLIEYFQNGKDTREAVALTFQIDYKKAENDFRQFLKQPKLVTKNDFSNLTQEFQPSAISEAKSLAVLGEFLYYSNRQKDAEEFLEKSLKIEPNQNLALSTLALVKAKDFYYDEAQDLIEKAISGEPNDYLNYFRYAVVLSKQGMTEYGFVSGYHPFLAEKMRQNLRKAIELNPDFIESYALFAFVNYVRNEQLDESLKLLKKALDTAPNNQRYLLRLSELNLRKENFIEARKNALEVFRSAPTEVLKLYAQNTIQRIDTTEFQLNRIRNEKTKYVNDDIVTEKPLSEEEIRKLREKAIADQIKAVLRRPRTEEKRVLASLTKIDCSKEKIDFVFKTPTGLLKLQTKSFDEVSLLSFIEELSDFRLGCGNVSKENYASIIYGSEVKGNNLISIEFVPQGFKLQN
jgi:tetratricopeptide (TPR) repeat protein